MYIIFNLHGWVGLGWVGFHKLNHIVYLLLYWIIRLAVVTKTINSSGTKASRSMSMSGWAHQMQTSVSFGFL